MQTNFQPKTTPISPTNSLPLLIVRVKDVVAMTGISKATLYRMVKAGEFPPLKKISRRGTGFIFADVQKWVEERQGTSNV